MYKKALPALTLISAITLLGGCATHAVVEQAVINKVHSQKFSHKSFDYDVLYSQPKPGLFTGGEQMPLVPLEQAQLSIASAQVLGRLNEILQSNLPDSANVVENNSDFKLQVAITAKDKKGPAYARYDMAESMGKSLLTLGLGASEYTIVADFEVEYALQDAQGTLLHKNSFIVKEELDHERGKLDSFDIGESLAEQLLNKHLNITIQNFLKEVDKKA